jgi:hypothetical protein
MIRFRSPDDVGRVLGLHPRGILPALWLLVPSRGRVVASGAGAMGRAARDGRLLMLLGAVALITMIIVLMIFDGPSGLWLLMLMPVFTSLFIAAGTAVRGALGWRSMLGDAMIRAMLGRHTCPSCGYDLRGIIDPPAAPDAGREGAATMATCPECGGCWRLDRLGTTTRPQAQVVVVSWR